MAQSVPPQGRPAHGMRLVAALTITLLFASAAMAAAAPMWTDVRESLIPAAGTHYIQPDLYRTVSFDYDAIGTLLASAPAEGSANAQVQPLVIQLPLPGGGSTRFAIVESSIMAPALQQQF